MPRLIATWNGARGVWETPSLNLLCGHWVPFSETLPTSGSMRSGSLYPPAMSGRRTGGSVSSSSPGLLPTPAASRFNDGESLESWQARNERLRELGTNGNGMGTPLPIAVQLLPTPLVTNRAGMDPSPATTTGKRGTDLGPAVGALLKTPTAQLAINGGSQHPDKRRAGGHGPTLADQVEHALLPTPRTADGMGDTLDSTRARREGGSRNRSTLEEAMALLPTPDATHGRKTTRTGMLLPGVVESLLPTPRATDGTKGGPNQRGSSGDLMLPSAVLSLGANPLLPTPSVSDGTGGHLTRGGDRSGELLLPGVAKSISTGGSMSPPSADGSACSEGQRPGQLSLGGPESGFPRGSSSS